MFSITARLAQGATAALLVALTTTNAAAAEPRVAVGRVQADGSISLYMERFHEALSNGARISEITVKPVDNYLELSRKARHDGGCHVEYVRLTDESGQPILAGSLSPEREVLLGGEGIQVKVVKCADDGGRCVNSIYLVPLGQPPLKSAHCEISELTGNKCGCLQFDGSEHHVVPNGLFCKSAIQISPLKLGDWVHLRYIQM